MSIVSHARKIANERSRVTASKLVYMYRNRLIQAASRSRFNLAMSNCACAASQKRAVDQPMASRSTARLTGMRPCPDRMRLIFALEIFSRVAVAVTDSP